MSLGRKLLLVALMLGTAVGGSAMIQTLSIEDLVAKSDVIIIGSLKSSRELSKDPNGFITVENLVTVTEVLKGEAKPGQELTVDTLAGFEDEVVLKPRQPAVLFLAKNAETKRLEVNNLVQGHWPLDEKSEPTGMGFGYSIAKLKDAIKNVKEGKAAPPMNSDVPEL